MILCSGAGITPQEFPQLPAFVKVEGDFTEESFAEHMRDAFKAGGKEQFETATPVTPQKTGQEFDDAEHLAAYLLSIAKPVVVDEQPKMNELELAVKPQLEIPVGCDVPDAPEFTETPKMPEFTVNPEIPEIPVGFGVPDEPQKSETSQITANPEPSQDLSHRPSLEVVYEYFNAIRELVFGKDYEGNEILTAEQIKWAVSQLEAGGKIEAATTELIQRYAEALNFINAGIPQAELPEAHLAKSAVLNEQAIEKPIETFVTAEKHPVTQLTPEVKEFLEKFAEVKLAVENGKSAQMTAESEKPEELLKAWETVQKAHVVIQEKPEEFNELLEKFKAQNPEKSENFEKPQKSEAPVGRDVPGTPQESATTYFEPKPAILAKAELPQLPQSTVAQVSEQVLAKLTTATNGTTTFEMILNPVELGKIAVKIVIGATGTAVEITAEKAATAQLLQNSADRIGLALDKGEAKLESFIVNVENKQDYSEQRENQSNNRGEQQQESEENGEDEQGISFAELLQAG
ncbi:MAG: flagellar hook-length control protein FliK [Oscillospiraceae bacterium]|nr:flagellar hook-length control protein FliK [Oscillospiraceae bacterium]